MDFSSHEYSVGAVIVAAGSSRRMQGIDKQELLLSGVPVLVRSIRCFEAIPQIRELVVVCREDMIPTLLSWKKEYSLSRLTAVVRGGDTRQQSVQNGINALSGDVDYYCIHDGARPFAQPEMISRCLEDAVRYGAATAAVPVKDTVKKAGKNGMVESTPDRSSLYLTQTPQIFEKHVYSRAVEKAQEEGADCTDDCQLVERLGFLVRLSQGSYYNIKITTPEDLPVAQAIADTLDAGGIG